MIGTDANTGRTLQGAAHLYQSVRDILLTPIGSRVCRREYGSKIFSLIDAPANAKTLSDIQAAAVEALTKWEPRLQISSIRARANMGFVEVDIEGIDQENRREITLKGIRLT